MAVRNKAISLHGFQRLSRPAIGLPISHAWLGYGDALFLELGRLRRRKPVFPRRPPSSNPTGEMTVMIEGGWRVERPRSVLFGIFSSDRKITNGVQRLVGRRVMSVALTGRLSELLLGLDDKLWVQSFSCGAGAGWCLFLPEPNDKVGFWLTRDHGRTVVEMGYGPPFPEKLWKQVTGPSARRARR